MTEPKVRLLIVDDAPEYLRSLEMVLRRDFEVCTAGALEQAKEVTTKVYPRVALIDVCLDESVEEDRSGLELMQWLRMKYPRLPLVAMSALEDTSLPEKALTCGADAFVKKPVDLHDLRKVLAELVRRGA